MALRSKDRLLPERRTLACCLSACLLLLGSCRRGVPVVELDHPQLTPQVRVLDAVVHSAALGQDMPLRIVVPAEPALAAHELPVVYLLHGAGANLHDWTNHSAVAGFAAQGFVLVFPNAPGSYYVDDLRGPHNDYERYLTQEIVAAVHAAVPSAMLAPQRTALVGISRGGYGAVVLGLKHPELFGFIGTLSGALDLNQRHFHWSAPLASRDVQRAFGPLGSLTRRANDPYELVTKVWRNRSPYFFVACGRNDRLLSLSERFTRELTAQQLPLESHFAPGGHDWGFWSGQLPALQAALQSHLASGPPPKPLVTAGLR